jgi:ATP-dependent Zn protease
VSPVVVVVVSRAVARRHMARRRTSRSCPLNSSKLLAMQDKIMMGAERKSMVQTAQCRRNTAYHEAGHALVALNTKGEISGFRTQI